MTKPPPKKPDRLTFTPEQRTTGLHVVGAPNSGKSKLMEQLIRDDIDATGTRSPAVIAVDPHGSLYSAVVEYCAWRRPRRPVYFLNVSAGDPVQPFNPFLGVGVDTPVLVDRCIEATIKAQGASNTDETPRLERRLRELFHLIVERGLSIAEAALLLDYNARAVRAYLSNGTSVADAWRQLDDVKTPTQFEDQLGSCKNRITRFTAARAVCRFMAITDPALNLDLLPMMDAGGILLVNLQPSATLSPMNARLFGSLLVARIFEAARRRELRRDRPPRPCHVYLDEFQNFVTVDLAEMLAQCRKMGICLTLAHQFLEQVRAEDPRILAALHGAASTKVVFRVGSNADACDLAPEVWPGQLDYNEVKRTDRELRFRPVDTRDTSRTKQRGGGTNATTGTVETDSEAETDGSGQHNSRAVNATLGKQHGTSEGHTEGEGASEGFTLVDTIGSGTGLNQPIDSMGSGSKSESNFHNTAYGSVEGTSTMSADITGEFDSKSEAVTWAEQMGEDKTKSKTRGRTNGKNATEGHNDSWSESETDAPVTKHVPYQHATHTLYTLDEQRQRKADELRRLPQRVCMVRVPEGTATRWPVPDVKPVMLSRRRVAEYEAEVARKAGALPAAYVEQLIQERHQQIEAAAVVHLEMRTRGNQLRPETTPNSAYEFPQRIAAKRRIRPTPQLKPAASKSKPPKGQGGPKGSA